MPTDGTGRDLQRIAASGARRLGARAAVGGHGGDNLSAGPCTAAGASSVVVEPGIDLTSSAAVVATLQGSAGSAAITVSRCVVNVTTDKFTIYLTKSATQSVKVAWHLFG